MKSDITARLEELKKEYQKGQERLVALEQETTQLGNTMLRISGAIQVLEELTEKEPPGKTDGKDTIMHNSKSSEK